MPYNIKAERGKLKGKFMRTTVKLARTNLSKNLIKNTIAEKETQVPCYTVPEGRRVVELNTLADELCCSQCHAILSLKHVISEQRFGLASVLKVSCHQCNIINIVNTNKHQEVKKKYAVNCKLAIAMYDTGIGEMQLNSLLSELNIPTISTATLKKLERSVGPAIEAVANESCEAAVKLEIHLTEEKNTKEKFFSEYINIGQSDLDAFLVLCLVTTTR